MKTKSEPRFFPLCLSAADLELIQDCLEWARCGDREDENRRKGLICAIQLAIDTQDNWPSIGAN